MDSAIEQEIHIPRKKDPLPWILRLVSLRGITPTRASPPSWWLQNRPSGDSGIGGGTGPSGNGGDMDPLVGDVVEEGM
jgi:hypothetical protein